MTEKEKKDDVFPEHPEPIADTSTPYDDDDDECEQEQQNKEKVTVDLKNYFEIILMTSPVAGIKLYLPRHKPGAAHVLMIQNPSPEQKEFGGGITL